jgi:hypothetical protein
MQQTSAFFHIILSFEVQNMQDIILYPCHIMDFLFVNAIRIRLVESFVLLRSKGQFTIPFIW